MLREPAGLVIESQCLALKLLNLISNVYRRQKVKSEGVLRLNSDCAVKALIKWQNAQVKVDHSDLIIATFSIKSLLNTS